MAKEKQYLNDSGEYLSKMFTVAVIFLAVESAALIVAIEGFEKSLNWQSWAIIVIANAALAYFYIQNKDAAIKTSGVETKSTVVVQDDDAKFRGALAMEGFMKALDANGNPVLVHKDEPSKAVPMVSDKLTNSNNVSHLPTGNQRLSSYSGDDEQAVNA